ncbi:MAG: TlpA disulfide reductase family protein [Desulfobacterium sp.]|nr:TlpA disulfide reductase family protein [Desulfobacterium sp.]
MKWILPVVLLAMAFPAMAMDARNPGEKLLGIRLETPDSGKVQEYLGLAAKPSFTMDDLDADVAVVEVFSMYCPHCQREAPSINRFYDLLVKRKNPGTSIKLIGIGVGNSQFEVDYFRKTYDVPFPLFADGDFVVHRALGEVRTPYFIVLAREEDRSWRVVMSRPGGIESPEAFLTTIVELTKGEN